MSDPIVELDKVFEVLSDGKWHEIREFVKNYEALSEHQKTQLEEILKESEKVGLIETDGRDKKGSIRVRGTGFIKKITELPKENQ